MMNPLRYFSKVAAASPKKLSFDNVALQLPPEVPVAPFVVTTRGEPKLDPLASCELLIPGVAAPSEVLDLSPPAKTTPSFRGAQGKRVQSPPAASEPMSPTKLPTPGRGKKTTNGLQRGSHQPSAGKPGHHHRRSLSNVPRLDSGASTATDFPQGRILRQSASFSGISVPRGGRPPTSGEISVPLFGSSTTIAAPRSAGKSVRYANSKATTKSVVNGYGEEPRIELNEDPTFWMDHSVQVLIRARPLSDTEVVRCGVGRCVRQENPHTVSWLGQPETRFTFDHVAGEFVTQEELFRVAGLPMVDNCMAGYNSCMFAYGQTGSGKTHTMLGDIEEVDLRPNENRGMTPRVFEYLFAKILKEEEAQKHAKLKYKCKCSFLEIYNEQISDLLEPSSTNLQMREDVNKGVYVEGLLEVKVQDVRDVLQLLLLGATNRKVAATNMNRESSRSHCVFTCVIESQWECDSMINFRFGRLNLVDLAGSERQKATGADGERLREAASINKSLSTLGLVIMVLVDIANGKQRHVPYRDSKLTFLLQDSLGGNSKTTIIANISPSTCASSETLSTLKFAQRAKFIQNNAVINEDASGDVRGLQEQIQQLKDELARLRRQSISRMPSVRVSEMNNDEISSSTENSIGGVKDGFDPLRSSTEGSFLQFGRAVLGPTALSQKLKAMEALLADALRREMLVEKTTAAEIEHLTRMVKHREDETCFHKTLLESKKRKVRRLEGPSETDSETSIAASQALQALQDECDHPGHMRLAMENHHLQGQLRRCQEHDAFEERETMFQEIQHFREKLLDMLDRNIAMDAGALPPQTALVAELAAERQVAELLRKEVEVYRRDLSDCRMKLQTSSESNERMLSELDAVRMELESSQKDCRKQRRELGILQVKSQEVEGLELKQAQHQQFMFELKTQLQKSEERAQQEASRRSQLELQLQETLQESTNLQTELQWTRDALEEAEALVETLQRNEPELEIGEPGGSYESFMIAQLQAEIIEMHARLEDECRRGRELEEQIAIDGKRKRDETKHSRNLSTDSCDAKGRRRVRHHDAIMQLQLELESLDGGSPSAFRDAIKGYRWEEGTRDDEAEVKHTVTIMQLQLDVEALEGALAEERQRHAEAKASCEILQVQLADAESKFHTEKEKVQAVHGSQSPVREAMTKTTWDMDKMQEALVVAREHFSLERTTLSAAVEDAKERYTVAKNELAVRNEELQCLEERSQQSEARELVVQAERVKLEEEILKLKELAAQELEVWVLERSDLLVAVRDSEACCAAKNQEIINLERMLAGRTFEKTTQGGLRNQFNLARDLQLENKLVNITEAMEQLACENTQLLRQVGLLRSEAEDARKLVAQKEEELAPMRKKLTDMENLLEKEDTNMNALTLFIRGSGESCINHAEKGNHVRQSGSELVKSIDRSLRALPENRMPRRLSDGGTHQVGERQKLQDGARASAEKNAKLRFKLQDQQQQQQNLQLDASKAELQVAMKETERYKDMVQRCEAEMERLTLLLLEAEERQIKAEQGWREEKFQLQAHRHEADLETAAKKLKLPARFAKMERWRQQVSEAESLMSVLMQANEKAKQECSLASVEADKLLQELLEMVASTKEQLDATMGHAEEEFRALVAETQFLKSDIKKAFLDPCKAVLAEQESIIHSLQAEVSKARKQTWSVQADQGATVRALHEKEETIKTLLIEVNQLKQSESRNISFRQSLTKDLRQSLTNDEHAQPPLRRSFSCKLIEEKEMTLTVLKEETEFLKTLVFSLDTENGDLQQQVLDFEAEMTALKSTIAILERERLILENNNAKQSEDVAALFNEVNQLKQSESRNMSFRQSLTKDLRQGLTKDIRQSLTKDLRQSLTKDEHAQPPLRRSFSCKLIEEKEMTLTVFKEETEFLKTLVFSLDVEICDLQQQALDFEAEMTALKSTIAILEREKLILEGNNVKQSEDVVALVQKLQESTHPIGELDCQRSELRDEMQRQAVSLAADYAELQTQENLETLEDTVRTDGCEVTEEEKDSLLQLLEDEKAELESIVERLGVEVMAHKSESRNLKVHVQALQQEIAARNTELREIPELRTKLETELQSKYELATERAKLEADLSLFMEQLERAQAMATERDTVASEARKMAELSKIRADEKQVETEILGRSIEELERTVYALESQVGLLKRDCDRQRLLREEMESELQGLQNQMSIMHAALTEASSRSGDELAEMKLRKEDAERMLEGREAEMQLLRNKLEKVQVGLERSKSVEIVEPARSPMPKVQRSHSRSASAFGCIKLNQQVLSELEEERNTYQRRIQELEDVLESHENEVTMLHEKLEDAERMTRDVLRVLRSVKVDMTNVAALLDEQKVEEGRKSETRTPQKDEEIEHILTRLNDFIEERESWLEMISQKQSELIASQAAVEKLRERETSLVAENKKFKIENRTLLKKLGHLEQENKTLSGQQNLQQRIKHHARIKDDNDALRVQNNALNSKLRRAEHVNTRVSEELAKYRTAQDKTSALNVDEEQRLRNLVQEVEEQRDLEAQKLAKLCSGVIKAAGMADGDNGVDPAVAVKAVEQLKDHLESTRQEFEDFRLKTKILGERHKLNDLRAANSPLRGIDPQLTPR